MFESEVVDRLSQLRFHCPLSLARLPSHLTGILRLLLSKILIQLRLYTVNKVAISLRSQLQSHRTIKMPPPPQTMGEGGVWQKGESPLFDRPWC